MALQTFRIPSSLYVSGNTQIVNDLTASNITGSKLNIVTSISASQVTGTFFGDGSRISGIPGVLNGGTAKYIPYWITTSSLGNSNISFDSANSRIGIDTLSPGYPLDVNGAVRATSLLSTTLTATPVFNTNGSEITIRGGAITGGLTARKGGSIIISGSLGNAGGNQGDIRTAAYETTISSSNVNTFISRYNMLMSGPDTGYAMLQFGSSSYPPYNWHIGSAGDGTFNFYNDNFGYGLRKMYLTNDGILYLTNNGTKYFQGGDDAALWDVNIANTLGVYGVQNSTIGSIKLGSGGGTINGSGGAIGVSNLAGSGIRNVNSDANGYLTNATSDARLKKNLEPITSSLSIVEKMNPVKYSWIDQEKYGFQREVGFIAQEIQQLVPEVIGENSDKMLSLDYSKLVAIMAGAIQELSAKVKYLENLMTGSV